jgi:hypothetical protein
MLRPAWIAVCFALALTAPALAETEVDVALVLAVDVSRSMDPDEQELQRQGFIEAFRSPLVHDAIRNGMLGRVAVTYMEWSGDTDQKVVVPWMVIEGPEGALEFSDRLSRTPPGRIWRTSISAAIDFSVRLLETSGFDATRRVIDISGDGPNSSGRAVEQARDEAVAKGVTINGLPIMLKRPSGFGDMENLDLYYRDCVTGGTGSFIVPVRERQQFVEAIKTKIIREVAALEPVARVQKAQAEARVDCFLRAGSNWDLRRYGP